MGSEWDTAKGGRFGWIAWRSSIMVEAKRVLKPGSHGVVSALSRRSQWMATALEDAGFEIRDVITPTVARLPRSQASLKPSSEHWVLVRKRGKGLLNIDACRIETGDKINGRERTKPIYDGGQAVGINDYKQHELGRWPANVVLSEHVAAELGDKARYFYCPKASKSERERGLDELPKKFLATMGDGIGKREHNESELGAFVANNHPCVKPLALMRWLTRLVTPAGGLVVDPFAGSCSGGVAAVEEGFRWIGCDLSAEYVEIGKARLDLL